ncbi:MAG: glycosyltransferase [Lachnospiraceae bacterium]|nr:glycosyltransferase [Lachnospiraceae bacterium]
MFPLSVCIIAKNEEAHIEECLSRLVPYGFEIVLTDTGSTDRTLKIAGRYTDRIYHFDWCDDFSAARNFCMEKASHNWILSLDCDEYIEKIDIDALRKCMEKHPDAAGRILIRSRFTRDGQTSYEQMRVSRLADRRYFHFLGAVHEQLAYRPNTASAVAGVSAAQTSAKKVYDAPVTILHVGYDLSESEMQEKSRRNIALLEAELAKEGPDPYLYYQLGLSCRRLKDHERAFDYFDAGLSLDVDPNLDYVKTMVESYGYTMLDLKRNREALELSSLYDIFAVRADFVFLMGLIYMNNGLFDQAISEFQKASSMEDFAVEGTNSYMANYNIGVIYECTGHITEARKYYEKCGEYEPAKQRLSEIQKA